jgi:hypothetical protein
MKKGFCFLASFSCLLVFQAATAYSTEISVRREDCHQLVSHIPDDDVAFVPGVDVRGRKVAPADLGGGYGITAPDEVNIDIRLDLAERLGLGENPTSDDSEDGVSNLITGEGVVGRVNVKGRDIYWNDSRLPLDSAAALAAACRTAFTSAGIPLPLPKPAEQESDSELD